MNMTDLLLMVVIGGERVAINADRVSSVVEIETVTPVPRTPDFIAGLAALRSRAITVIDCRAALEVGEPTPAYGHAVVVEDDGFLYALMVDAVEDVTRPVSELVDVRAELLPGWTRCAIGMVETEAGPMLLVDPAQIVAGPPQRAAA